MKIAGTLIVGDKFNADPGMLGADHPAQVLTITAVAPTLMAAVADPESEDDPNYDAPDDWAPVMVTAIAASGMEFTFIWPRNRQIETV